MTVHRRLRLLAIVAVVLAGAVFVWNAATAHKRVGGLAEYPALQFVDLADGASRVEAVALAHLDRARVATGMNCLRVYTAAGTTVCLRISGPGPTYEAAVFDQDGQVVRTVALPGTPSRAQVSASGNIVSWTSFVTGDSYSFPGGFSTRTGVLDLRSGEVIESLEGFATDVDGRPMAALDVNYWGVTVASDDRTFYATLASASHTWLVRGDLVRRTLQSLRRDAECPSLAPDEHSIAYKKRVGRFGPWDLAVLNLDTGEERRLPGTVGIDDQAAWLDSDTLAYAAKPVGARIPSIYRALADGSAPADVIVPEGTSPSVVG